MGTHPIFESDFDCLTEKSKMSLSADMQQRIEKSDAQEVVDEAQLKEHARNQLKEFYSSRTKHLESQPKFESFAPAIEMPIENATLADVLKYIESTHTSGDIDERRERMRQVFQ